MFLSPLHLLPSLVSRPAFLLLFCLHCIRIGCIAQPSRAPADVPTLTQPVPCALTLAGPVTFSLETLSSCPAHLFNWYVMRSVRETLTLSLDRLLSVWVCENDWLVEDVILKLQEMLRGKLVSFHRRRLVWCWFNLGYSREYLEGTILFGAGRLLSYCLQILYSLFFCLLSWAVKDQERGLMVWPDLPARWHGMAWHQILQWYRYPMVRLKPQNPRWWSNLDVIWLCTDPRPQCRGPVDHVSQIRQYGCPWDFFFSLSLGLPLEVGIQDIYWVISWIERGIARQRSTQLAGSLWNVDGIPKHRHKLRWL